MKKRFSLLELLLIAALPIIMGLSISSSASRSVGALVPTIPVITNGTISTVVTVVAGGRSNNLAWCLTNEDATNGFRCEYGTTTGTAPTTTPTASVGRFFAPNTTFCETINPNSRLDCITVASTPKYSLTVYPQ